MGVLPGYECQPGGEDGTEHSKRKLQDAANDLRPWCTSDALMTMSPCQSEDETFGYRCVCTFQLLWKDERWQYAMRHNKEPLVLGTDSFPISTKRIQKAMEGLILQSLDDASLSTNATSVAFASSWGDDGDGSRGGCIVTLMYEKPIADENLWKASAQKACNTLQLTKLVGRSKGRITSVTKSDSNKDFLEDTVYLYPIKGASTRATLSPEPALDEDANRIEVYYQKPETAFFHPNSRAMLRALEWMLQRLTLLCEEGQKKPSMLEMFCGCGAHTVALAKSGLVESIVAVELDKRLVNACIANCKLNGCWHGDLDTDDQVVAAPVYAIQGDASEWAKKRLLKKKGGWYDKEYSVLLVDPPRMGLDEHVCQMACEGHQFQDLLYISCGRHALKRDLESLKHVFEVVDCHLLDLFPRTDAVETLVHLKRRHPSTG